MSTTRKPAAHPKPKPMPDEAVKSAADFVVWLNHHISGLKRSVELLGMTETGRQILRGQSPFQGTGEKIKTALKFANKFNVDLRHLTPQIENDDIPADDAAIFLEKIANEVRARKSKRDDVRLSARRLGDEGRHAFWDGEEYTFSIHQADVVRLLWDEYMSKGTGLHQAKLQAECELGDLRIDHLFRRHRALGKMIFNIGEGIWTLGNSPKATKAQKTRKQHK